MTAELEASGNPLDGLGRGYLYQFSSTNDEWHVYKIRQVAAESTRGGKQCSAVANHHNARSVCLKVEKKRSCNGMAVGVIFANHTWLS